MECLSRRCLRVFHSSAPHGMEVRGPLFLEHHGRCRGLDTEAAGLETNSTHAQLSTQLLSSRCLLPGKCQHALPTQEGRAIGIILKPCVLGALLFGQQADLTESEGKARADSVHCGLASM